MIIDYGKSKFKNEKIQWKSEEVINGHSMIVGTSGTGKTYRICRNIDQILSQNTSDVEIHIFDVHGDIIEDIENQDKISSIKFSESSEYGINPLKINPDPDYGGVRKRIQTFISQMNSMAKLGGRQEGVIRNLLLDLYETHNFFSDNFESWKLDDPNYDGKFQKKFPTVLDLKLFTYRKLKSMIAGGNSISLNALEELNKKISSLDKKSAKYNNSPTSSEKEKAAEDIEKLKNRCIELYTEYINNIESGKEIDDLIKYDSKETINSVYNRIENLYATGIFKNNIAEFDENKPVKHYNFKSLSTNEQRFFIDTTLEDIYLKAKVNGIVKEPKIYIIIDEAHLFINDNPSHIINILMKEARKFGIALIVASQSFTHFSDDMLMNFGTKIVLGIAEIFQEGSAKKLGIEVKRLRYIIPQQSALIQISTKGGLSPAKNFTDIIF